MLYILQALCIFEGYIFKFEYMQAQISIGTRAQLLILHLYILQALCIFEDYIFKFEYIISGLKLVLVQGLSGLKLVFVQRLSRL